MSLFNRLTGNRLPESEDLAKLSREKQIKFAQRCALRVLPVFDDCSLIWEKETVPNHLFAVCWAIIMADDTATAHAAATAATTVVHAVVAAVNATAAHAAHATHAATTAHVAAHVAARAADATVNAARAAHAAHAADYTHAADYADYANAARRAANLKGHKIVRKAIIDDYGLLRKNQSLPSILLQLQGFDKEFAENWQQRYEKFTQALNNIGFVKLAQDIDLLWDGEALTTARFERYNQALDRTTLNSIEDLLKIFEKDASTAAIDVAQVVILGPGGAGKTTLKNLLLGKEEQETQPTVAVNIDALPTAGASDNDTHIFLWDFGGQTLLRAMHPLFLSERTVFLLVVDSRHQQSADYWLKQIEWIAGRNANVLLLTNVHDQCYEEQNITGLTRRFSWLEKKNFHTFDFKEEWETNKQRVQQAIDSASKGKVLSTNKQIFTEVNKLFQDGEPVITFKELEQKISQNVALPDDFKEFIRENLEPLGMVKKVGQQICLSPNWVAENCYTLIHQLGEKFPNQSSINFDKIAENVSQSVEEYLPTLLDFMVAGKVAKKEGMNEYYFPDASAFNEPEWDEALYGASSHPHQARPYISILLDFHPLNLHTQWISRLADKSDINIKNVWRTGFEVENTQGNCCLRIHETPNGLEVYIGVSGSPLNEANVVSLIKDVISCLQDSLCYKESSAQINHQLFWYLPRAKEWSDCFAENLPLQAIYEAVDRKVIQPVLDKQKKMGGDSYHTGDNYYYDQSTVINNINNITHQVSNIVNEYRKDLTPELIAELKKYAENQSEPASSKAKEIYTKISQGVEKAGAMAGSVTAIIQLLSLVGVGG